ncbi:MAG: hypothetical protein LBP76_11810 [Treponema sp.]|jgi:hypothetical protein|nr:hypothetical protein [Treponema sp.]
MGNIKQEEIRAALEGVDREVLADALSLLLAEEPPPEQAVAGVDRPELANFAQAVGYLKKHYDFSELDFLTTEGDLVYVRAGDRRVLLTSRESGPEYTGPDRQGASYDPEPAAGEGDRFSHLEI